jgi:hypothetical protein
MLIRSAEENFSPSNLPLSTRPFNERENEQNICPLLMKALKEINFKMKKSNFI